MTLDLFDPQPGLTGFNLEANLPGVPKHLYENPF